MIFSIQEALAIKTGKQTLARFPVQSAKCRYKKGRRYVIEIRGHKKPEKPSYITVTEEPTQALLGDLTLREAKRMGFRTRVEAEAIWEVRYGSYDSKTPVWMVSFELGDTRDKPRLLRAKGPTPPICTATITWMEGDKEWKTQCGRAFADNQTVCKCGKPRPPEREEDHGYTNSSTQALRGTAEEVSEAIHERYAANGRENHRFALVDQKKRLDAALAEIRKHPASPQTNRELRAAQKRINKIPRSVLYTPASSS